MGDLPGFPDGLGCGHPFQGFPHLPELLPALGLALCRGHRLSAQAGAGH